MDDNVMDRDGTVVNQRTPAFDSLLFPYPLDTINIQQNVCTVSLVPDCPGEASLPATGIPSHFSGVSSVH